MPELFFTMARAVMASGGLASLALLLLWAPLRARGEAEQEDDTAPPPAVLQLVDVDGSGEDRLREAAQWAQEKRYDEVVDSLHTLMTAEDKGLCPHSRDPRRYQATGRAAARLLATLPGEVVELYVKRHGLAAEKLFEVAAGKGDEAALCAVGESYFHTPHGALALARVAALAFDRGDYLKAAALWERLCREHRRGAPDRALLLCKACVAYHLGGAREQGQALLREMKEKHGGAEATIAGQPARLLEFLEKALAAEPPAGPPGPQPMADWPSFSGSPRSVAVVGECRAAPSPLWGSPEQERSAFLEDLLSVGLSARAAAGQTMAVSIEGGRVRARRLLPGQAGFEFDLPPLVHPVTFQGMVLCRRDAAVTATALDSGKQLWRTQGLPMYRDEEKGQARGDPLFALAGDMGRYALTVGDGRAYAVCKFSGLGRSAYAFSEEAKDPEAEGSSLVSLSLGQDGASTAWEIGNGKGDSNTLRQARYLAAPTLHQGRLYVLAREGNRYHAVCLNAANGALVWETPLGLVPMRSGGTTSWQQAYALEVSTERGSPLAVAEGLVFLATNSGIVVALEAAGGRPVWAHRYDSRVSGPAESPTTLDVQGLAIRVATLRRPLWPVNPLIIAQGRVLCLPCDSEAVLALHAQTGELLWRREREDQQDLTALGEDAVLLSGPGLLALGLRDGAVRFRASPGILGRPAVTPVGIVAAGEGSLLYADLAGKTVHQQALLGGEGLLGRMLVAEGRLVAANAAGLTCYADFETAWTALRAACERAAQPAERAMWAERAGSLALSANRLDEAAAQLSAAAEAARRAGDAARAAGSTALLFDARIRQARAAVGKDQAARHLEQAAACAATAAQREQVLLEQVRHEERLGRSGEAVRRAQAALERQAERWRAGTGVELTGYFAARREAERLVRLHGQELYAPFDAAFDAALKEASARQDPRELLALQRRWPCARQAGEALLQAAEVLFRRAVSTPRPDLTLAMQASCILGEAGSDLREQTRRKALAAQAVLDLRLRPHLALALAAELQALDAAMPVRFGAYTGSVGDLLAQAAQAEKRPLPAEDPQFGDLASPVGLVYQTDSGALNALLDARGEVVRLGERTFWWSEHELVCLDARRNDFESARLWAAEMPPPSPANPRLGQPTASGRQLAVLDGEALVLLDALTGKLLYRRELEWLRPRGWTRATGSGDWLALAGDRGLLSGVKTTDGKTAWRLRSADWGALTAASEVLLAYERGRSGGAVCLDIRTGRLLAELSGRAPRDLPLTHLLTPEGLLLGLQGGAPYSLRDARWPGAAEKRIPDWGGAGWRTMAAGSRFAGFQPAAGAGLVRVLDLLEPDRAVELNLRAESGAPRQPVRLAFDGQRALVLCAEDARGEDWTGLSLAAFSLPDGKKLWDRALLNAAAGPCRATRLWLYGHTLSLAAALRDGDQALRHFVVRTGDGEVLDISAALAGVPRGAGPPASPVVANGRILVPLPTGVACLMSLRP